MKHLQRFAGILTAFCLMIILFFTSVEAVVYWTPGYFEKEYTKYQVLDDLPSMTMDDLLDVTDQMMAYLKGKRADLHVSTHMGGETREFFNEREIAHMEDVQGLFFKSHCPAPDLPGGLRRYAFIYDPLKSRPAHIASFFPLYRNRAVFCSNRSTGCYYIHQFYKNISSCSTTCFLPMTCGS